MVDSWIVAYNTKGDIFDGQTEKKALRGRLKRKRKSVAAYTRKKKKKKKLLRISLGVIANFIANKEKMFHVRKLTRSPIGLKQVPSNDVLKGTLVRATAALQMRGYADHQIPERLKDVPNAANPKFFDMVEYFFHRACQIAEDKLVEDVAKRSRLTVEERKKKVKGILMLMEPCDHILETSFPLRRDSGDYEMITGYRAQHSTHRIPCKGGMFILFLLFIIYYLYIDRYTICNNLT